MVVAHGRQLHQPRLAEIVADVLRQRILGGELADGELMSNQERLLEEFRISMPSLREALRMLEAEGLITVRRGNVGGAEVHRPEPRHAAYTLALILQGRQVRLSDVADALRELEAMCAGMCAQRPDRSETVVPVLAGYNARSREVIDDHLAYVEATSNFHQSLLTLCGNQTMEIIAGSVEMLWLSHVQEWAELTHRDGTSPPTDYRVEGIEVHEAITSLIKAGAVSEVMAVVRGHFNPKQFQRPDSVEDALIQASMLRSPGRVFAPASSRSGK